MRVIVQDILQHEPNSFNGLDKTTFMFNGEAIYMFSKPENVPTKGQEMEGEVTEDKAGRKKFKKAVQSTWGGTPYDGPKKGQSVSTQAREDGMQRGNALNNATNLVIAYKEKFETVSDAAKAVSTVAKALYGIWDEAKPATPTETSTEPAEAPSAEDLAKLFDGEVVE